MGFDSRTTAYTEVDFGNAVRTVRGIIFNPGSTGFTLSSGTVALNRGGIINYSEATQTFNTTFNLQEGQYWDGRTGGLTVNGSIDNGGKLLIIQGSATNRLTGAIFGSGGLAKDGHLVVSNSNSYTGRTFIHNGTLIIKNTTGSATGTGAVIVNAGMVTGNGKVAGDVTFVRGTRLTSGDADMEGVPSLSKVSQTQNRLTFGANVSLDGQFVFHLANYSESVGFTQIALDGAAVVLTLGNNSSFTLDETSFLGMQDPNSGHTFWNASHTWTLFEIAGSEKIVGNFGSSSLGTWAQGSFTVNVNAGTGNDVLLVYTSNLPEPSCWILLAGGSLFFALMRKSRPSGMGRTRQ